MKKILIIKLGYSETLDAQQGRVVSLGDVIRCSVVLEPLKQKYPQSHISWLVAHEAVPLIAGNRFIDRVLVWDEFIPFVLMREKYDMVINLEKLNGICALADMVDAWEKVGFRFNSQTGEFDTYSRAEIAKVYMEEKESIGLRDIWQRVILHMLGFSWNNQRYSLGYEPKSSETYDVGFNYKVGSKWPTKGMGMGKWEELEEKLKSKNISYSYQQGMENLYEYMEWINSCKILITNDSLGLHLAFALGKKAIGLFGSTDSKEIYFYEGSIAVMPTIPDELKSRYECIPCYRQHCDRERHCMEYIDIDTVVSCVKKYLS